jgi:MFS family permease
MVWSQIKEKFSTNKVIFAVILIRIFNRSVTTVFGLLFEALFWRLNSTQVQISLILNLTLVISNISGIIAGYLTKVITTKTLTVTGTFLVSIGLMMTSYVSNYAIVIFTYSVTVGIGIGLITVATFLAIMENFSENTTEAVALSSIGGVVGKVNRI